MGHDRSMWIGNLMLIIINLRGRHLGAAAAGTVSSDVSLDRDLLRDRHLLHQQCARRRHTRRAFGLLGYWLIKHDFEQRRCCSGWCSDR